MTKDAMKKAAKTLLKRVKASDMTAIERVQKTFSYRKELSFAFPEILNWFCLMKAQHVIAKECGYEKWGVIP